MDTTRRPWWFRYGWPIIHPIRFARIWRTVRRFRQERERDEALRPIRQQARMYAEIGLRGEIRQRKEHP